MKNLLLLLGKVLLLGWIPLMMLCSCDSKPDDPVEKPIIEPEPGHEIPSLHLDERCVPVQRAVQDFGWDVFRQILQQDPSENALFSPLSLSLDLALCASGAQGQTQAQMLTALGFQDLSPEAVQSYYQTLCAQLSALDASVVFESANAVWLHQDYRFQSAFLETAQSYFHADLSSADFADWAALAEKVNGWASEKTHGMIGHLLDKDQRNASLAILANAVYFKGGWTLPFDKEPGEDGLFQGRRGERDCHFMTAENLYPYRETEGAQLLALPYGHGNFQLILAVPKDGTSFDEMLASLSPADFAHVEAQEPVFLQIPRFTVDGQLDPSLLQDILSQRGMVDAFDPLSADFSGMIQGPQAFYIDAIAQKSRMQVDEKGAEAAAVTWTSVGMAQPDVEPATHRVRADQPFVYALLETGSQTPLFFGALVL